MIKTALLVIDMQKGFFAEPPLDKMKQELVEACNELIAYARSMKMPIFNVRTQHSRDTATWTLNMIEDNSGFLFEDSKDFENLDGLDVEDSTDLIKTRDSAFYETTLASALHTLDITQLILCGVSAQACLFQTAADAYAHNFEVIIARDATASDKPALGRPALDILANEYRQVVASNNEIVSDL